jgi:hypothetical protein
MAGDSKRQRQAEDDLLDWFTVSYRTLYAGAAALLLALGVGAFLYLRSGERPPSPARENPAATSATARFVSIEGSVKVRPSGVFDWLTADKSMTLRRNDLVRTNPGATAEIEFFDGTVVHVRPDSLITIEETSQNPATRASKVGWHISSGEVNFQTARRNVPGSSTAISTQTVRMTADELTQGGVRVADAGDTEVKVFKGAAQAETRTGQKVALGSNEAVRVDAVGKAGAKLALPEVPVPQAPPHGTEITYPDPGRSRTLFLWKGVTGANGYHFQIDYSPYFNRPLLDRKGIRDTQIELQGLDVGKYYWRVAALGKDDSAGGFSDFSRFAVARPQPGQGDGPPPPLIIESVDVRTNILQIKGRTEPGATVTVNGQRVDVGADGAFNEFITLDKPGRQTIAVRAVGLNGGIVERKRDVVVGAF